MRTPYREMMSHIVCENIFMSPFPFPRFEIPKMNRFRTNTDSSSIIIIDGEYLLLIEYSLHPAPASSWLDFRYKEKKKRNRKGGENESKSKSNTNNQTDTTLFYFQEVPCFTVQRNSCFFHINSRANTGT